MSQANRKDDREVENIAEFEWIQLNTTYGSPDELSKQETGKERLLRKLKDNPFVPIGCLCTAGVLITGLWNMQKGNRIMSQRMMRLRVLVQGVTLATLMVGAGLTAIHK